MNTQMLITTAISLKGYHVTKQLKFLRSITHVLAYSTAVYVDRV